MLKHTWLLTVLSSPLLLAAPALAKEAVPAVGSVEISGNVDVPLYMGLDAMDPFHYVEAKVGDKTLLLRLATGHGELRLSEGAVGKLGLKAKGKDDKKHVKVDAIELGAAKLSGTDAKVTDVKGSGSFTVDGELGLAGFPDMAWAVMVSEGVLRLAPAAQGAALVSALGGTPVDFFQSAETKEKVGKDKTELGAIEYGVSVSWSGQAFPAQLRLESKSSSLAFEADHARTFSLSDKELPAVVQLPAAPARPDGILSEEYRALGLAGAETSAWVKRSGLGTDFAFLPASSLGVDTLGRFDLAVDPVNHKLAARAVSAPKKADYSASYEANLRKALEGKEGKDRAGGIPALASYLESRGRLDEALALRTELTTYKAEDCTSWLALGNVQLDTGRASDAAASFQKSLDLYGPWAAKPLAERKQVEEDKAKAEEKEGEWTGAKPQSHTCHTAVGGLAAARLGQKDFAGVAALYPSKLDLDASLPLAAGSAELLQSKSGAAQAAYRQAVKLTPYPNAPVNARVGLFLAYRTSQPELAREQLSAIRFRSAGETDPVLVRLYVESLQAQKGDAAALDALQKLAAADPTDAVLQSELGRALQKAGQADAAAKAFAQANDLFSKQLTWQPSNGKLWAKYALSLVAAGKLDEAKKAVDQAARLAPADGSAWLAASELAAASGDATAAKDNLRKAALVSVENPAFALLLQ